MIPGGYGALGGLIGSSSPVQAGMAGLNSGIESKINEAIMGSPGEQARDFMDEAYPGTNAVERLGGGGGGAGGVVGAGIGAGASRSSADKSAAIQKYGVDTGNRTKIQTAQIQANAAKDVAKINAGRVSGLGFGGNVNNPVIQAGVEKIKGGWDWVKQQWENDQNYGPRRPLPNAKDASIKMKVSDDPKKQKKAEERAAEFYRQRKKSFHLGKY